TRLRCLRTLSSIFAHPQTSISHFYILSLAPTLFQITFLPRKNLSKESELRFLLETLLLLESLIQKGGSPNAILMFLIPALVNHLLCGEELFGCSNALRLTLHAKALHQLTALGKSYPTEFRAILGNQAALKGRLEAALKDNQVHASNKAASSTNSSTGTSPVKTQDSSKNAPSIKLSTDFSNFVVK
ncbi:Uncharacterized protein FKW44_001639, partial [Caligus rogercresseyi]